VLDYHSRYNDSDIGCDGLHGVKRQRLRFISTSFMRQRYAVVDVNGLQSIADVVGPHVQQPWRYSDRAPRT